MTWPIAFTPACHGSNGAALPQSPTSLKSRPAKRTTKRSPGSQRNMGERLATSSSCRPVRPTTNWRTLNPCGQTNSVAFRPKPAIKHAY